MMAKKPADRPASMSDVVDRLEACRTFAGRADEARSGRKATAESVNVKPVSPGVTVRDSDLHRDDPASPQLKRDRALDERNPGCLAATVAQTLEESALIPDQTGSARPLERAKAKAPAFALGALTLLAIGSLGYALFPLIAGKPQDKLGTASDREKSSPIKPDAKRSPTAANAAAIRAAIVLDVLMW